MPAAIFHVVQFFLALLAAFFFLALVFGHFLVGHLVVLASGEHGSAACVAREVGIADASFARAKAANAVGNYAIQLTFSDGHSTGIYSYDHLRTICPCATCAQSFR